MLENVKGTILDFLKRKDVDYALMINGVWGAGKTFFAQNSLQEVFKSAKLSPVYVSLNGVCTFEEVAAQIVFGTGWRGTKAAVKSFLLPFAMRSLPEKSVSAILSALQAIGEKKTKGWWSWLHTSNDLSPKTHVLILDDMERVSDIEKNLMPIMGRMFDEFISRGYHVVFIGDETHIGFPKFKEEKEKYIRHTVTFRPDIETVVDAIANSFAGVTGRYAQLCCSDLKMFASLCNIRNVRVIKRIMDDFVSVAKRVNDQALIKKIAHTLMFRLAPIVAELAAGRLKASDKESISELENIQVQRYAAECKRLFPETSSQEMKEEKSPVKKSYAQEFMERYDGKLPIPWAYDRCIVEYEIGGELNDELLKKTVQGWLPAMSDKYAVALNAIWGHRSIEDSELLKNCPIVEEGLKDGMYNAEHVNLACELLNYFTKEGYITIDCDGLIKLAVQALRDRWTRLPNDNINPMLLREHQRDFRQPIMEAIQEEQSRRNRKLAEEDVTMFLAALSKRDREASWQFLPRNRTWRIFDEIVEMGKCDSFCALNNWALCLVAENLKDASVFIKPSSVSSIRRIAQELDAAIGKCDSTKSTLRKTNLVTLRERFLAILNSPQFVQAEERDIARKADETKSDQKNPSPMSSRGLRG